MKRFTIGCLALFGSVFGACGARAEHDLRLDREVTSIYVPRAPYWEAVQELVCQLEIPAGLSLGCLPATLFPGGLGSSQAFRIDEMSQGYADLRINPAYEKILVGPIKMRRTTVRAALDRFCKDSRVFQWKIDGGVVLIEPVRSKMRPHVLSANVPFFMASKRRAADLFSEAVEAAELPRSTVLWEEIVTKVAGMDDISLPPRAETASWRISVEMRDVPLQDVLTQLVRGAPDHNGLWICYELPDAPGFSGKQPVSRIFLSTWSPVRRKLGTDELVRELVQLRKKHPHNRGTRGYIRVAIQMEDYWLELAKRAHFDPETVSRLLLEQAFADTGEPRLGVHQLVALGLQLVTDALAEHALSADSDKAREAVMSEVPPPWAFEGAYREFWDKLAGGGFGELVARDTRIQKRILALLAKRKGQRGVPVSLAKPAKAVWLSPFSASHMHNRWPGWPKFVPGSATTNRSPPAGAKVEE